MTQMTIYDLIPTDDLESMSDEEMVRRVSEGAGIPFKASDDGYAAKIGKVEYTLNFGRYPIDDRKRFIRCGYTDKSQGYAGGGAPCNSVEDAVEWFKGRLKGDCATCYYKHYLHPPHGGKAKQSCCYNGGHGGCKWKPIRSCLTCDCWRDVVDAYTCKPLGYKACFSSGYNHLSPQVDDPAKYICEYWEEIQDDNTRAT